MLPSVSEPICPACCNLLLNVAAGKPTWSYSAEIARAWDGDLFWCQLSRPQKSYMLNSWCGTILDLLLKLNLGKSKLINKRDQKRQSRLGQSLIATSWCCLQKKVCKSSCIHVYTVKVYTLQFIESNIYTLYWHAESTFFRYRMIAAGQPKMAMRAVVGKSAGSEHRRIPLCWPGDLGDASCIKHASSFPRFNWFNFEFN